MSISVSQYSNITLLLNIVEQLQQSVDIDPTITKLRKYPQFVKLCYIIGEEIKHKDKELEYYDE